MEKIIIENATVSDAEGIARVHVETWRTTYTGLMDQKILDALSVSERAAGWVTRIQTDETRIAHFIARRKNEIVGFCSCGPKRDSDIESYQGEVYAIYVLKQAQGLGVGQRLMAAAESHLHTHQLTPYYVWVLDTNPYQRFYKKLGAVHFKSKSGPCGGAVVPEYAFGFCLNP